MSSFTVKLPLFSKMPIFFKIINKEEHINYVMVYMAPC